MSGSRVGGDGGGGGGCAACGGWGRWIGGGEGKEDGVCVPGTVGGIGVRREGNGVEDALDVVFLNGGEKGFVGGGVVGESCRDWGNERFINIFSGYEFEALVTGCVR